jgi:hypothetical protein
MWDRELSARQIDLNARYNAIKAVILASFYDAKLFRPFHPVAVSADDLEDAFLILSYVLAVYVAVFCEQFYKTDLSDVFVLCHFLKFVLIDFFINFLIYIIFLFLTFFYVFKIFFTFAYRLFKFCFLF